MGASQAAAWESGVRISSGKPGLAVDGGLLINRLIPERRAGGVGIRTEEVILTLDGKKVTNVRRFQRLVAGYLVGPGMPQRHRDSSSLLTAEVFEDQIQTIERLLQRLPADATQLRFVWPFWLMLAVVVCGLNRFLRRIRKLGAGGYRPAQPGLVADKLRNLSAALRRLAARGDAVGLGDHLAFKPFFRRVLVCAGDFLKLAGELEALDSK